jgi:hypothetical protein
MASGVINLLSDDEDGGAKRAKGGAGSASEEDMDVEVVELSCAPRTRSRAAQEAGGGKLGLGLGLGPLEPTPEEENAYAVFESCLSYLLVSPVLGPPPACVCSQIAVVRLSLAPSRHETPSCAARLLSSYTMYRHPFRASIANSTPRHSPPCWPPQTESENTARDVINDHSRKPVQYQFTESQLRDLVLRVLNDEILHDETLNRALEMLARCEQSQAVLLLNTFWYEKVKSRSFDEAKAWCNRALQGRCVRACVRVCVRSVSCAGVERLAWRPVTWAPFGP